MIPVYSTPLNSYRKWAIGNDIRTILLADSEIVSKVSQNIYPLVAPENVSGDFIIYGREKYNKGYVKMGVYEEECVVFVTAISDNYDNAVALASSIDNALCGDHIISNNTTISIDLADSTETFDDNKYIETLLFKIK